MESSISADRPASVASRDLVTFAERWNHGLMGDESTGPWSASALRLLSVCAAMSSAHSAVAVGCQDVRKGLALFEGLPEHAVLTIVEPDPERLRLARDAFTEHKIATTRTRLIAAAPLEVLARLTDGGYGLFLSAGNPEDHRVLAEEAARLLRPGGVAIFVDVADAADPAKREARHIQVKEFLDDLAGHDRWLTGLLPMENGIIVAILR